MRHDLVVEARGGDGDVMHALASLPKKRVRPVLSSSGWISPQRT
jgi:hypothetical protein